MKELFERLLALLKNGRPVVMATIIAESGSTPRGAGARMLVDETGRIFGTIGGGIVEYKAEQLAVQAMKDKASRTKAFTLRRNEIEDIGMICGGNVRVFIQYIEATEDNAALVEKLVRCFDEDENAWLFYDVTDECAWQMALYSAPLGLVVSKQARGDAAASAGAEAAPDEENGKEEGPGAGPPIENLAQLNKEQLAALLGGAPLQTKVGGRLVYSEPVVKAGRVIIFGGGHVSQELVPVLAHLDFRCVVFEDRPDFAKKELFPGVSQVILGDFSDISKDIRQTENDYIVVMTRGHAADLEIQRQVLRRPAAYFGVIGSRHKIAIVSKKLLEDGISQQVLDTVHMPIGLNIKGQTPAELAISIAGELILTRAERAEAARRALCD